LTQSRVCASSSLPAEKLLARANVSQRQSSVDAAPKIPGFTRASRLLSMPKASPKTDLLNEPASYELALEELEQLVGRIESGQMPLDQMLAGYQRGAALLAFCRKRLDAVQDQIKVLDEGSLQAWGQE